MFSCALFVEYKSETHTGLYLIYYCVKSHWIDIFEGVCTKPACNAIIIDYGGFVANKPLQYSWPCIVVIFIGS